MLRRPAPGRQLRALAPHHMPLHMLSPVALSQRHFKNLESGSVQVPPITSISLANSAEYKAQTTAAKAALNLPPVNSPMPVDNTRARHISFANFGKKTIGSFVSGNNGEPLFGGGAWVLAPNTYVAFSLPTPFIGN